MAIKAKALFHKGMLSESIIVYQEALQLFDDKKIRMELKIVEKEREIREAKTDTNSSSQSGDL